MARRAALIKRKPKKVRTTRTEAYIINRKYMGDEPDFLGAMTQGEMATACNWYNCMCDKGDAREYTETWLKSQNRLAEIKKFKTIPDEWVNLTCAWIARLINRGYEVPEHSKVFLEKTFAYTLTKAKVAAPVIGRISIQDRMKERQSEIIADIEEIIDSGEDFSLYEWLKKNEIPSSYTPAIATYYQPWVDELHLAYLGKDPDLREAYRHMSKKQLKARIDFFETLISDAKRYGDTSKKVRAPTKPRTVSVDKKIKSVRFLKESNEFKLASINPDKILGAQELWCFDTKWKVITVLRALDRGGLDVDGIHITKFDEKNSFSRRGGKQSEQLLQTIMTGGKMALKKVLDGLTSADKLQSRTNENTILLKAIK